MEEPWGSTDGIFTEAITIEDLVDILDKLIKQRRYFHNANNTTRIVNE